MWSRSIIFLISSLTLCGMAVAQDSEFAGIKARGPLSDEDLRESLNKLLSLDLNRNGRLSLSRESWDQHGRTEDERVEYHMKEVTEHLPRSMRNQAQMDALRDALRDQIRASFYCSLTDVYYDLCNAAASNGGRRSSGGGGLQNGGYSLHQTVDSLDLLVSSVGPIRTFDLSGSRRSRRHVRILDDPVRGAINITIEAKGFFARLDQQRDSLSVTLIDDDLTFHESTKTWNDFADQYPQQANWLTKTIKRVGIRLPVSESDPVTATCVQACLASLSGDKAVELEELLEQMRSGKADDANAAAEKLINIAPDVHYQLELLWDRSDASKFQEQVGQALQVARRACTYDIRYMTLVRDRRLCDSPEYLVRLAAMDARDARELVFARLAELTDEDSGSDLTAWQTWIANNPDKRIELDDTDDHGKAVAEKEDSDNEDSEGIPEPAKKALANVLCFQVDTEGRISVETKSWVRNSPPYEVLLKRKIKELSRHGRDAGQTKRMARSFLGAERMVPGLALIENIQQVSKQAGGSGFGRSGTVNDLQMNASGPAISIRAGLSGDRFEFQLDELTGPRRRVRVMDEGYDFQFSLDQANLFAKVDQEHKKCRVLWLDQDGAQYLVYDAFSEFADANPELAQKLIMQMRKVGANPPPTWASANVRDFVVSQLMGSSEETKRRFNELLAMLDANEFEKRQQAAEQLRQGYRLFAPLISELTLNDLHPETRKSLAAVQEFAKAQNEVDQRFANYAIAAKLKDSPRYLTSILTVVPVDDRKAIYGQLKKITSADPGDSVEAWTKWVKENVDP